VALNVTSEALKSMYLKEDPNSLTFSLLFYLISDPDANQQKVPVIKCKTNAGLSLIALNN